MGVKTYQEKNTSAMEKKLAQSDIPVKRKIQKTIRKYHFPEVWGNGDFQILGVNVEG